MYKKLGVFVLVFIVIVISPSLSLGQPQQDIWFDDFETGGFTKWDLTYDVPEIVSYDSHSGSYAVELEGGYEETYKQGSQRHDAIIKYFPYTPQRATVEAWVKVTQWSQSLSDICFIFINTIHGMPYREWTDRIGRFHMYSETGGYYWTKDTPLSARLRFSHNLPMHRWVHLKLTYDSSNGGVVRYYENNILRLTIENFGTEINGFCLLAKGCCGPITFLVDDISYSIEEAGPQTGAVEGYVTDSATGGPIKGAEVCVNGYCDETDEDGYYLIEGIPIGQYQICANAEDYEEDCKSIEITAGVTLQRDFQLVQILDPQLRLLHLMNDYFDFYEEYYDYDDELDCSIGKCSDQSKTNVSELEDDDIWIVELYPVAVGFMQGDDLSCQIDGNTWYKGPDPEGRTAIELQLDVADFIPDVPGSSEIRDFLQTWFEGGATFSGAVAHAKAQCEGKHEAEVPVRMEVKGGASGLPVEVSAGSEFCMFYNPETDNLDCFVPDPLQIDGGIHTSLSEISRHYSYNVFDNLIDIDVDIHLLPEIGLKCNMRTPLVGPISPVALVAAFAGFVNVDSDISVESELPIFAELEVVGNPYIIIEALYSADSVNSIKSPYYYDLEQVTYNNLESGDMGFRVHVKPDLRLKGIIDLPDPLPDIDVDWTLPIPEFEHREGITEIRVGSPVDLHVYDSTGHHVGTTQSGIEKEIKYSNYFEIDDEKLITVPSSLDRINVVVVGEEQGTYNLHIRNFLDIINSGGEIIFTPFDFEMKDVAIQEGEVDYLDIDFDEIKKGIQNKVNMGLEINQAIQETVGALDFDQDGTPDIVDHSLNFDKPPLSLITEDIEAGVGQNVILSAKLHYLGDPMSDREILFFVDGNPIGSAITDSSGTGSLNYQIPVDLNIGDHCLKIVFPGNEQYGPSHTTATLTVVNLPPDIQLMSPHNGETLSGIVSITGQVKDTDLAFLNLKIDGSKVSTILPYDWNTTKYVDGLHLIELVAGDEFGNTSIERRLVYVSNIPPGDLDGDGDVDLDDLNILLTYRNQPASACPECDIDGDGVITVLDARKLVLLCTRPRCATE
ncbi:MAG: carboxypeptidase regulatory-like domain-containing protein [Candidatus Diapherotrites archaeon]|nr:carboxypeptidase regulatory-like domain-containing protein [Candidatus Diapherotrites archaeon]